MPLLLAAGAAGGCAAVLGIQDVPGWEDAADAGDASADGAGAVDGSRPPNDAPGAMADGCLPSPEDCANGIDDDCDGLVDCADPACQKRGFACVPKVPDGWTYAGVDTTGAVTCPAGWAADDIVAAASGDPASCSCGCVLTQMPSCTHDAIHATIGQSGCTEISADYAADGACHAASYLDPYFAGAGPPPLGGACGASVNKSVPSRRETHWSACTRGAPLGGGCAASEVCAFVPPRACIVRSGAQACPQQGYVESHTVGTGVGDTRDCSGCTCGGPTSATCSTGTLTFYTLANCQQAYASITTSGACQMPAAGTVASYAYTSTPSATCGTPTQPPAPIGSVTLTNAYTACCVP